MVGCLFEGLQRTGVLVGGKGKVRLRRRDELDPDWNPATEEPINRYRTRVPPGRTETGALRSSSQRSHPPGPGLQPARPG